MGCQTCGGTGVVHPVREKRWENADGRKGGYWKRVNEPCPDCCKERAPADPEDGEPDA